MTTIAKARGGNLQLVRKTGKRKERWNGKKRRDMVAIVLSLTPKLNFTLIQYPNPGAHCYRSCLQGQQRGTPSLASDSRQVRLSWALGPSRFPLVRATGQKENPLTSVLSQISQIAYLCLWRTAHGKHQARGLRRRREQLTMSALFAKAHSISTRVHGLALYQTHF